MATKLETTSGYLLAFATGQGAGVGAYSNYPTDLDTNFGQIRTTVNTLIDEVNSARLADITIPQNMLLSTAAIANATKGRFSNSEARYVFAVGGTTIQVTGGRIYFAGRQILVVGATLTRVGTAAQTNFVSIDVNGVLYIGTVAAQNLGDILSITSAASVWVALTDLLGFKNTTPLNGANMINRIYHKGDGTAAGLALFEDPPIRLVGITGTEEDAGFVYEAVNTWRIQSQRATSAGVGAAVTAHAFTPFGQHQLLEQGRFQIARSTAQAIATGAGFTAITFDAAVANTAAPSTTLNARTHRREPAGYVATFANPFYGAAAGAVVTIPNNTQFRGTYLLVANVDFAPIAATGFVEAQIVITNGTAVTVAYSRQQQDAANVSNSMSLVGMVDLAENDTIALQVRHGNVAAVNVTRARFGGQLIGGVV